jgi:signal transduction histidine kinase
MRWPLRRQILLPMVGIVLLAIAVISALNAALAAARVRHERDQQLASVRKTLAASNFPLTDHVLQQTRGLTGAEFVATDLEGTPVAASNASLSPAGALGYIHAAIPLDRRPVEGGQYVLHVFYPEAQWREARWQAAWPPLAIGGAAVLLVGLAAILIARLVTQPLERLREQVGGIAEGRFEPVTLPGRDDEIRTLAVAVNQMAARLAQYEHSTRQSERLRTLGTLGGGIAHQIRNAATGCRIALDLHQRDCPQASSNGHADQPLAVAVRQLELIETHIQRLLALGRPPATDKRDVDLVEIVQQAIELVRPSATHLGVELQFSPPGPARLAADAASLVQLVVNLLVNGVEAAAQTRVTAAATASARAGTAVRVVLTADEESCQLAVIDPGAGPSPQLQPRLFEPFATDKPGGTGLGLAVVRQIAQDHGGTVCWERRGDETWFLVELPVRSPPLRGGLPATESRATRSR